MKSWKNIKRMDTHHKLQILIFMVVGFSTLTTTVQSDTNPEEKEKKLFIDAVGEGDCNAVKAYLHSGVSANTKFCSYDGREITVLMFAASQGHTCTVSYLIAAGANINVISHPSNIEYDTPLTMAIKRGGLDTVDLLIKSNSRIDVADGKGQILATQALNNADEWSVLPGHPPKEDVQKMRSLILEKLGKNPHTGIEWNAIQDAQVLGRCASSSPKQAR
ncbi:MAG: ankyrin repeat domain-containing protein [Methylicorpusculum sp.]|uniref:ankyrin repeat domain-containing protein n=1 Tax=Methylicorpusculum sp. TaxID=2713644 RepID=UPI00271F7DA3|nr:ankyrin repeat domain-containing protein [Methylicorpusculum sp.]MDO8939476.1 ankyrin repeat domain-containing protein [Methylicorpusculum sp.]MDP2201875.1 ankyrin repeat domain-containing protein [Methylicorpusculum sp.]